MRSKITIKPKIQHPSLTDAILKLCASGHYGVREAIATATQQCSNQRRDGREKSSEEH